MNSKSKIVLELANVLISRYSHGYRVSDMPRSGRAKRRHRLDLHATYHPTLALALKEAALRVFDSSDAKTLEAYALRLEAVVERLIRAVTALNGPATAGIALAEAA